MILLEVDLDHLLTSDTFPTSLQRTLQRTAIESVGVLVLVAQLAGKEDSSHHGNTVNEQLQK